jgi:hypothetical protein
MDEYLKHMTSEETSRYAAMKASFLRIIQALPPAEMWAFEVLRSLDIQVYGVPPKIYSGATILAAARESNCTTFCRWMWFYTRPKEDDSSRANVFETIAECRDQPGMDAPRQNQLRALEQILIDFNSELGFRCAEYSENALRSVRRELQTEKQRLHDAQDELAQTQQQLRDRMHSDTKPPDGHLRALLHRLE